ncbi:MAG: HAD hydrolase-like protein [Akkermansia sp.]
MFKNIIFDWSGTLVDDLALTLDASNYVFRQYGKEALSTEDFREEFQLPYPDYYAKILPDADLNELEDHFRQAFRISEAPVSILPHAREFMDWCQDRGIRCFALTSVDNKEFIIQARELGMLHYFEAVHAGIRHKDQHIHHLLNQHGLNPDETAFIGDMQHDIKTAHVGGITAIAVLTGYNNAKQLAQVEPDLIVPNLSVLRKLFRRFSSTPLGHLGHLGQKPSDTITLHGLSLTCHIGVPDEERATPQTLLADIQITLDHPLSGLNEKLDKTVDYDALAQQLEATATDHPRKLIETLAEDLAQTCINVPSIARASVTIKKFILPQTEYVSVSASMAK